MEGPSRPETAAPRGQTPRGCETRNAPSDRLAGRGAAHLSAGGGAVAGTTPPPPNTRRAPPRLLGSFRPRFGAARLPSRLPSLPRSRGAPRARDGELAGDHLGARFQPCAASPKLLPGKGAAPSTRPSSTSLDSWCLHVPPPPPAGAGFRAQPREWGSEWRGPRPGRGRSEVQEM